MCFEKLRLNKMFINYTRNKGKQVMMKFSKSLIDILITWFSNFLHGFFFTLRRGFSLNSLSASLLPATLVWIIETVFRLLKYVGM